MTGRMATLSISSTAPCGCFYSKSFWCRLSPNNVASSSRKGGKGGRLFFDGSHVHAPWLSVDCNEGHVRAGFELASLERETVLEGCEHRPSFDLDLAVLLAGFAFESYNTPPEKAGIREVDAIDCEVTYTDNQFLREVYKGLLKIKLLGGTNLPGLDLWGTSDPYVVFNIGGTVARSRTCWATLKPVWNEKFSLNVKDPSSQVLSIAAWDANIITAHRRLGNTSVSLEPFADGEKHVLEVQLEGIGGGGVLTLEIQYRTFEQMDLENRGWGINLLSEFLKSEMLDSAIRSVFGKQGIKARDFVSSAFGLDPASQLSGGSTSSTDNKGGSEDKTATSSGSKNERKSSASDDLDQKYFQPVSSAVNRAIEFFRLGTGELPRIDLSNWQLDEKMMAIGLESQAKAEAQYIERGLALPGEQEGGKLSGTPLVTTSNPEDLQQVSRDTLHQTEEILGSWMMQTLAATGALNESTASHSQDRGEESDDPSVGNVARQKATKDIFKTAESAMEAWAMLATASGSRSFVKSEFDKICFVENKRTDTQVAVWRDDRRRRVVVAFRGTEQTKWKDVQTDLMLVPTGLNPERVGGGYSKDEILVHSGFLSAYDSVRPRLLAIMQDIVQTGNSPGDSKSDVPWHVYVTGHSLGGALATLYALELAKSKLANAGLISISMYNYGSPRVGNKAFAEKYNELVKDSWRIVNHRDIIPTVPRLMGYRHVAEPIYLAKGIDLLGQEETLDLLEDGYRGDTIGEVCPDYIIEEVVRGEMQLLEKLIHTEVAMFKSIRDGTAIMQHMEDFYYIALLELVEMKMTGGIKSL